VFCACFFCCAVNCVLMMLIVLLPHTGSYHMIDFYNIIVVCSECTLLYLFILILITAYLKVP